MSVYRGRLVLLEASVERLNFFYRIQDSKQNGAFSIEKDDVA